jgi:hypothetical protein
MGNQVSAQHGENNVFQKDLGNLNGIINSIISEKNLFKNRDYNFLSKDVCNEHYLLMENELNRHLKVELQNLGTSLYIIPKNSEMTYDKSHVNKKEICQKVTEHYMKILYILCLIKYVFNLENGGDYSISGIVFRNIKIVDNIIEINFCNVPHKDYTKSLKDAYKIDFGKLEGLQFLTQYFLDKDESFVFVKIIRRILARSSKKVVGNMMCNYVATVKPGVEHMKQLEKMYSDKFNEKLVCRDAQIEKGSKKTNLYMYVEKDNPILSNEYCYEKHKYVIQLNTPYGKKVTQQYNTMRSNYVGNISSIERLMDLLILKNKDGSFTLRDIDKHSLDKIVFQVKDTIKTYYMQSLMDFQTLLDIGKNTPNINIIK